MISSSSSMWMSGATCAAGHLEPGPAGALPSSGPMKAHCTPTLEGGLGTPVRATPTGEPSKHRGRAQALMPQEAKGSRWLRHGPPGGCGEGRGRDDHGRRTASLEEWGGAGPSVLEGQQWKGPGNTGRIGREVRETRGPNLWEACSLTQSTSPGRLPQLRASPQLRHRVCFED